MQSCFPAPLKLKADTQYCDGGNQNCSLVFYNHLIARFIFRSIQSVNPSALPAIYPCMPANRVVIGQVRVAADKPCLADVNRKD